MRQPLEVVGFLVAAAVVVATLVSTIKVVVLPRATESVVARATVRTVRSALRARASRARGFGERDRIMAMLAPLALISMLAGWLSLFVAYSVIFFAVSGRSFTESVQISASSLVTLGIVADDRLWPSVLSCTEAAFGLLVVALFITYFPSIYGAFTRRETGVTLLQVRAGDPPRAATMLIRYHRIEERRYQLTELWRQWEEWFADIEESHTTFPVLAFFRSPQPERSWVTAAGALLDGASFWVACVEHPVDPDVQLCIRAGFLALRRIADAFNLSYDPDPAPTDPISVTRGEWDAVMDEMAETGMPLAPDREAAWAAWRGWRVNYDTVLLLLARMVEAPLAPWVSDRSPVNIRPGAPVRGGLPRNRRNRRNGRRGWGRSRRPSRR